MLSHLFQTKCLLLAGLLSSLLSSLLRGLLCGLLSGLFLCSHGGLPLSKLRSWGRSEAAAGVTELLPHVVIPTSDTKELHLDRILQVRS